MISSSKQLKLMLLQEILMSSEEPEQTESFGEFTSNLLIALDTLELAPDSLWTIIRPTLYFSIPGLIGTILGYWLMVKDEGTIWEYLLLAFSVFFLATGIMFVIVGLTQLSSNRRRYTFTKAGLTIKPLFDEKRFISWEEMSSLEIEGKDQSIRKKKKCVIKIEEEEIVINIRGLYEPSSKSRNHDNILEAIEKYYQRMKKK